MAEIAKTVIKLNRQNNINLEKIIDANENEITVSYSGGNISKVTDGVGREITFTTGNGYLQKITDPAGRETTFTYNNGKLSEITHPDGNKSFYSYDGDSSLSSVYDHTGYGYAFGYNSKTQGKRVTSIQEKADVYGTAQNGQKITIDYAKYHQTVYRDSGSDDIFGNGDDVFTTYQFDNFGRTVSHYATCGGENLGGGTYEYSGGDVTKKPDNFKGLNKITKNAQLSASRTNLIKNGAVKQENGSWLTGKYGGNAQYSNSYETGMNYITSDSLKVTASSVEGFAGYYQDIDVSRFTKGAEYSFSGYIRTEDVVANDSGGYGACYNVQLLNGDTVVSDNYTEYITATSNRDISDGWKRVYLNFTVPQTGVTKIRVWLGLRGAAGKAWFNGIQLIKGDTAEPVNLVDNSSLEYGLYAWRDWNVLTTQASYEGTTSLTLLGYPDVNQTGRIDVELPNTTEDDTFVLSCWSKANAAPPTDGRDVRYQLTLEVYYTDGTSAWIDQAVKFNPFVTEWQYSSCAFSLSDKNSNTNKTPAYLAIRPQYKENVNRAYFDNFTLVRDDVPSYTYNSDGKLISVKENAEQQSEMEYTNSDLTKSIDAKGYAYTYTYDDNHNMTQQRARIT